MSMSQILVHTAAIELAYEQIDRYFTRLDMYSGCFSTSFNALYELAKAEMSNIQEVIKDMTNTLTVQPTDLIASDYPPHYMWTPLCQNLAQMCIELSSFTVDTTINCIVIKARDLAQHQNKQFSVNEASTPPPRRPLTMVEACRIDDHNYDRSADDPETSGDEPQDTSTGFRIPPERFDNYGLKHSGGGSH